MEHLFDSSFVSESLGLKRPSTPALPAMFSGVFTDTRAPTPGGLFVALRGDKYDANQFVAQAASAGAAGVVCARGAAGGLNNLAVFEVENTTLALRKLAHSWRKQFRIPVVAVVGSVGKTTTKEYLAALLGPRFAPVLKTEASQNGFVGVALTLLKLRRTHQAAVIEIGIDEPGAMIQHLELVEPSAVVLSALGPEHLERLGSIEQVVIEETLALKWVLERGGTGAVNLDDPLLEPRLPELLRPGAIGFGLKTRPLWNRPFVHGSLMGDNLLEAKLASGKKVSLILPAPAQHLARNLLGAVAIAESLGCTQLAEGLSQLQSPPGRSEIVELRGTTWILDYYNSNPASLDAGLGLLCNMALKPGRSGIRWAVLGDMLELGPDSAQLHRAFAARLKDLHIESLLLLGPEMKALFHELCKNGSPSRVQHFLDPAPLAECLANSLAWGDTVLLKGSRGMRMEQVWQAWKNHVS